MATASNSKSLYAPSGSTAWTLHAEWTQGTQDVANNKTSITVKASLKSSSGSFSGGGGTLYIDWYDNNNGWQTAKASKSTTSMSAGSSISCSKTFSVTHNADGTLSGYARARWVKSSNSWTPDTGNVSTSNKALTAIPRASVPTMTASSYNINASITVNTNRKVSTYTHTVKIAAGSLSKTQVATGVGASKAFTLSADQIASVMKGIPNAKSCTATIYVTTYSGSTQIGSEQSCTFTLNVPNTYAPTLGTGSAWQCQETNTNISSLLTSPHDVVLTLSRKDIQTTATALNGAAITKVTVTNGSQTKTMTLGSPVTSGNNKVYTVTASFANLTGVGFSVTATDSRGFTKTTNYGADGQLISYLPPSFTKVQLYRPSETGDLANLEIEGNWYDGTIGSVQNVLSISYTFGEQSPESLTPTSVIGSTGFTAEKSNIPNALYNEQYTCEITMSDSFYEQEIRITVVLPSSAPSLWLGRDTVRINKHLIIEDDDSTISMGPDGRGLSTMSKFIFNQHIYDYGGYLGSVAAGATASFTLPDNAAYEIQTISDYKTCTCKWIVIPTKSTAVFQSCGFGQWAMSNDSNNCINFSDGNGNYEFYDTSSKFDMVNGVVNALLVFKAKATEASTGAKGIGAIIPEYLRPQIPQRIVGQGSNQYRFLGYIQTDGRITIERYGYGTTQIAIPSGAWLNITATYVARSYPVLVNVTSTDGVITVSSAQRLCHVFYKRLGKVY